MNDVTVRIYYRDASGYTEDAQLDMSLDDFGGVMPAIGDTILNPGVAAGLDRSQPENREVWKVVERVFNPRDNKDYVTLVVEYRPGTSTDPWL